MDNLMHPFNDIPRFRKVDDQIVWEYRNPEDQMDLNDSIIVIGYTSEEWARINSQVKAINDGQLIHPYPQRWPWLLITANIHAKCMESNDGQTYEHQLVPLLLDCILAYQAKFPPFYCKDDPTPPIVLDNTVAGTVWIVPNEYGGMTVMNPEDY